MAAKLIFTWNLDPEIFNKIREQPNLLDLRREFEMRRYSLSGSLLIWEKSGVSDSWSLSDIGNKKFYHIVKRSDTEMEVLEDDRHSITRRIPPFTSLDPPVHGTHEGFVDWLILSNIEESDLEELKRTDLSERKLDFEIVHGDLLVVNRLLREILTAPREWLVELSNDDIQKIRKYLGEFYEAINPIWAITLSTPRETHTEVLQEIFRFCDEVKRQLQQIITYLKSKQAGQLDLQTIEQLKPQVNAIVAEVLENFKRENNLSQESTKEDVAKIQEGVDQLAIKFENETAQESISEFKEIFADQAKRHQKAAWGWLGTASILIGGVVAGIFFFGLLDVLKLEGTEWTVVLQNIFKKGSVLTLFYFALNRSIKNYTAQKHLETVNRHRENALGTFTRFVSEAEESRETRDAVLLAATNAIFNVNESGYLSTKTKGTESINPIQQVFGAMRSSSTKSED